MFAGTLLGSLVTCIGVAHDTGCRVIGENALYSPRCRFTTVTHDYETGMLCKAHADATAVMEAHPGGTAGSIQECV